MNGLTQSYIHYLTQLHSLPNTELHSLPDTRVQSLSNCFDNKYYSITDVKKKKLLLDI